jgi:hypothetical protein
MRRVYMVSIRVTTWLVLCAAVGAAGFAIGLSAGAAWVEKSPPSSQSDSFASRFTDATPVNTDKTSAPRVADLDLRVRADGPPSGFEAPRSAALRYGVVELLPAGLTQSVTGQSALLRAILEAATAAAVEPVPANYLDQAALLAINENATAGELRARVERDRAGRDHQGVDHPEMIQLHTIEGGMPFP